MNKKAIHRSDGGPIEVAEDQTVADLVVRHPQLRERLEQLGIDYCCGGKRPLGQVVTAAGLEWQAFVAALNDTSDANAADSVHTNWNEVALSVLVDHILEKHHAFTKEQLSRLDGLLTKVEAAHGARHGEMLARLRHLYDGLHDELDAHLMKEEQILFPAIKEIDAFVAGKGEKPIIHCGSIANPIHQMEVEHDSAGKALAGMLQVTDNYRLPSDACQTFRALYAGLQALEDDLHEHIHLENNILFPKSIEQEKTQETGMNILYEKTSEGPIDEVGARLEQAAQNHKFGVLNIVDLKAKMVGKGVEFGPECRIYEVCNPQRAKEVLEKNLSIATALPCRIALYQEGESVKLSTLLPTQVLGMFETPELAPAAQAVEDDIKAIMDEAADG